MEAFLDTLPAWLLFIIIVGIPVAVAWTGTVLLRRKTATPTDEKYNEVAGFIFATAGVIYVSVGKFCPDNKTRKGKMC